MYALEGSIAVTGSLVQWLRDNLGLIPIGRASDQTSWPGRCRTAAGR